MTELREAGKATERGAVTNQYSAGINGIPHPKIYFCIRSACTTAR